MYKQLGNEIGTSQGISIALHEDDGGRGDNESHPPKKQNSTQKKRKKKRKEVRIYTAASASVTSLLDQRRLVHLYQRIQHPEMRNDGFVNVSSIWTRTKTVHKKFEGNFEEGWMRTLSSVTFQSSIFVFGGSFDHET